MEYRMQVAETEIVAMRMLFVIMAADFYKSVPNGIAAFADLAAILRRNTQAQIIPLGRDPAMSDHRSQMYAERMDKMLSDIEGRLPKPTH